MTSPTIERAESVNLAEHTVLHWKQSLILLLLLSVALVPAFLFIQAAANEVTQYSAYSFEAYAREALAEEDFAHALQICNGALEASLDQSEHWGIAYLLQAKAYDGLRQTDASLKQLLTAADFWTRRYYFASPAHRREAEEFGQQLGERLLDEGNAPDALRAFSAAGIAGGDPVAFLHKLDGALSAERRAALWLAEPFLILQDFDDADAIPAAGTEAQQRAITRRELDPSVSITEGTSALVQVVPTEDLESLTLSVPVYLPLTGQRFAIRGYVRSEAETSLRMLINYWFELSQESAATADPPAGTLAEGWLEFSVERAFFEERRAEAEAENYAMEDGIISHVGVQLVPDQENTVWFDRIDLYLPSSEG